MFYTIPHTYKMVDFKELFIENGTPLWEEVWRNTDTLAIYGNAVLPRWGERSYPELHKAGRFLRDNELYHLGAWLRDREIEMCVTAGAVKKWSLDAVRGREITERILRRLQKNECDIASIRIDESLLAGQRENMSPAAIAEVVVDNYCRPLQQDHDGLAIGVVEAWPGCPAKDIVAFINRMGDLGRLPPYVHIDINYPRVGRVGYVDELIPALETISGLGITTGIIAWSSNFHERPTSSAAFCRNTLDFSAWMHDHFDRFCDDYIVQSWLPYPTDCLPENREDTFMWLVREYGRQYVRDWDRAVVGPIV